MAIKVADRMTAVHGFGIDRVARAAEGSTGRWPVLRMENLDTDLPLPPEAVAATIAGLGAAKANSWLPFTGDDDDLRAAIADLLAERTGHRYDPASEVVVTSGGTEAALDCLLATVDPGDEVVLTDPTYAGLVNRVRLVGVVPRYVPFVVSGGEWRLDRDALPAAVGPRTGALLLMSPSMPSGAVLGEDDWRAVCELCLERDLLLIYDGAMERLLFDGRPLHHPVRHNGMADRTLVIGSLSKEFRMIGWRVGWVAGPRSLVDAVGWAHVYNTTTPVGIARAAATAVLRGDHGHVATTVAQLQHRRDVVLNGLGDLPAIRPAGGWSLLLDVTWLGVDAARHVRFVFSAEPAEALRTLPERLAAVDWSSG